MQSVRRSLAVLVAVLLSAIALVRRTGRKRERIPATLVDKAPEVIRWKHRLSFVGAAAVAALFSVLGVIAIVDRSGETRVTTPGESNEVAMSEPARPREFVATPTPSVTSSSEQLPGIASQELPVLGKSFSGPQGFRGPSFAVAGVAAPTGDKPQSKLWFNDGSWWGVLYSLSEEGFTIHQLDWNTQTWRDTGLVIDPRESSHADVSWDGTWLFIASTGSNDSDPANSVLVRQLAYEPTSKSYVSLEGFPVVVATGGSETVVLDEDSRRRLWVTYTRDSDVWVTHSEPNDALQWVDPFRIPAGEATGLSPDDISTVVAFGEQVAVIWSNQNSATLNIAYHDDRDEAGVWSSKTILSGERVADDHINVKVAEGDDSQLFITTKTSYVASTSEGLLLHVLEGASIAREIPLSSVADNATRPIVVLEESAEVVHVFAAAPCCGGGIVYHQSISGSSADFPEGLGTPVMESSLDQSLNNVTSTKQTLSASTGLVIVASDDHTKRYVHSAFRLTTIDTTPPDTEILAGPVFDGETASFVLGSTESAVSFECSLDGSVFERCPAQPSFVIAERGSHVLLVRAVDAAGNRDLEPATVAW